MSGLSLMTCAECKIVNTAMAGNNSTGPGSVQSGQAEVTPQRVISYMS